MSIATSIGQKMTSYTKEPKLDRILLSILGFALVLILTMFAFWESRQQATLDRIAEILSVQAAQMSALQEMVMTNRRELDRERR